MIQRAEAEARRGAAAGAHTGPKRTIDIVGDVTEEGVAKCKEEVGAIHDAFKRHVLARRPALAGRLALGVATGPPGRRHVHASRRCCSRLSWASTVRRPSTSAAWSSCSCTCC